MKLWASASAIGLSMAYLVSACSSDPGDPNTYHAGAPGTGGAPGGGAPTAGAPGGGAPAGGGAPGAGAPGGGDTSAGTGGAAPVGGAGGAAPAGGAGGTAGGSCPPNVDGHCDAGATYPTYPGYTLKLVEDFSTALDLDHDPIWTWSDGSPESGQTGFRKDQISFTGGKMIIKAESPCAAKTTNSACIDARTSYGEAQSPNKTALVQKMGVWSGELRTKYNNYRYGRYEVKFKAPIANPGQEATDNMSGDYLSTMFVFRTPKNVTWNEIDIELEPLRHNQVAGNVVNVNGATGYPNGSDHVFPWNVPVPSVASYAITQEHIYAFNWTPTGIDWFIDNMTTPIQHFAGTGGDPIPTLSAKIMMNLWVFSGTAFGDGANNKYPFQAEYDYFHFYKLDTEAKYPCTPAPACLDAADKTQSAQNNGTEMNYGM